MGTSPPIITGVDFVGIPTRDFDAAVHFYGTVLGLRLSARCGKSPGVEFETGNLTLAVYESEAFGVEFHPNKHGIALHVEDAESARAELESRGVSFQGRPWTRASATRRLRRSGGNALELHHRYAPRSPHA